MAKIILIDDVQEGQVLAEPVSNSFGQQLLPAGAVLEERHIHLLKRWNVRRLFIISDDISDNYTSEEELSSAMELVNRNLHWEPLLEIEIDLVKSAYIRKAQLLKNKIEN